MYKLFIIFNILKGNLILFKKRLFNSIGQNVLIYRPIFYDRYLKEYCRIGSNVVIGRFCRINCYPNRNLLKNNEPIITIGNNCQIGQRFTLLGGGKITIGNNVLIASDVFISSENHSINPKCEFFYGDQPLLCKDVEIQEGAWIGEKVCIMPGVTIGKKAVIGAGSIVTKNIPEYSIAVGNPCRVIKKYNFEKNQWDSISSSNKQDKV